MGAIIPRRAGSEPLRPLVFQDSGHSSPSQTGQAAVGGNNNRSSLADLPYTPSRFRNRPKD